MLFPCQFLSLGDVNFQFLFLSWWESQHWAVGLFSSTLCNLVTWWAVGTWILLAHMLSACEKH